MAGKKTSLGLASDIRSYNDFGELTFYTSSFQGNPVYSYELFRDPLGRVVGKNESLAGGPTSHFDYSYDLAGRLTQVNRNGDLEVRYTYDNNGNRTSATSATRSVTANYDDQDRLIGLGETQYDWSADGALLGQSTGGLTTSYDYDSLGNLLGVRKPDGMEIEYIVDGSNLRIGKRVNGALLEGYLYRDGLSPIARLDASGSVVETFQPDDQPNLPALLETAESRRLLLRDHVGTPRALLDLADGSLTASIGPGAFGEDSAIPGSPFGFSGGITDGQTGLIRLGARDYDPNSGRWTAKDPIDFLSDSTNLYAYVGNDPVNFADPTGLARECCTTPFADCWARCVEEFRFDTAWVVGALSTSALPKTFLPPFRVVHPSQRLTTPLSSIGHLVRGVSPGATRVLRNTGRYLSFLGTPLLIFEGFYDWGIIGNCAYMCNQDSCRY